MNNLNNIDFDTIKNEVSKFSYIEDSKRLIISEEVDYNPLVIKKKLKETEEAFKLIKNGFVINFDGIVDITNILEKSKKGAILTSNELSNILVFHNHTKRIQDSFSSIKDDLMIKDYVDSIYLNNSVLQKLDSSIDINGNIKNTATNNLIDIINKINSNDVQLYKEANNFIHENKGSLQEESLYIRNNRIAFLVKNSDKNKYQGYQYGTSSSGLATYLEPGKIVEFNNRKLTLEDDKNEEIQKILKDLSELVALNADYYLNDYNSIVYLNTIFAKAYYGIKNECIIPNININNFDLVIENACHPLINKKVVVPNTYRLIDSYKGIVISGTNTGGKTVGLKTIGLSILMTYIGIPIFATKALIPLYNAIYLDIDDKQSVINSLSTFSAHISNINYILNTANQNSLILIDELISGTDPKEAQAISLAILEEIENIKSNFVITTHYDEIKNYAYKKDNIMLSAVGFDLDNLMPTYKYSENSVGVSNAIEIANRYFDNKRIVESARQYLKLQSKNEDELMKKLSYQISEYESKNEELTILLEEKERLKNDLNNRLKSFDLEKAKLKEKYIQELNIYVQNIKDKANTLLNEIVRTKNNNLNEINNLISNRKDNEVIKFNVGDGCKIDSSGQIGEIIDAKGDNVKVLINGLIISTNINSLIKVPRPIKKEIYNERILNRKTFSKEINIIGKTVEESIPLVEKYLDNALLNQIKTIKIVHGIGTGKLRKGIREYLLRNKHVKTFKDGDAYDGLTAVTIVELK